jgi:hypothetical protein
LVDIVPQLKDITSTCRGATSATSAVDTQQSSGTIWSCIARAECGEDGQISFFVRSPSRSGWQGDVRSCRGLRLLGLGQISRGYFSTSVAQSGLADVTNKIDRDRTIADVITRINGITSTSLAAVADESVDGVFDDLCCNLLPKVDALWEDAYTTFVVVWTVGAIRTRITGNHVTIAELNFVVCTCEDRLVKSARQISRRWLVWRVQSAAVLQMLASGELTDLVHEVLDVADVGVAVASTFAAASTVDTKKHTCGIHARGNFRHTTSVY